MGLPRSALWSVLASRTNRHLFPLYLPCERDLSPDAEHTTGNGINRLYGLLWRFVVVFSCGWILFFGVSGGIFAVLLPFRLISYCFP